MRHSVAFERPNIAQRGALGVILGLFLLESLVAATDDESVCAVSPARYYDPTAILADSSYDGSSAAVLFAAASGLVFISIGCLRRKDIS